MNYFHTIMNIKYLDIIAVFNENLSQIQITFSQNFDSFNIKQNRKNGYCIIDIKSHFLGHLFIF